MTGQAGDPRVAVDGEDLDVRIDPAPDDIALDEHGVMLLADVVLVARTDTVATVRVRGTDDFHYAAIVMRDFSAELAQLHPVGGDVFATDIVLSAGERVYLTVVASDFESGMAWLEQVVAQGGMGGGGEEAAMSGDDAVAAGGGDEAVEAGRVPADGDSGPQPEAVPRTRSVTRRAQSATAQPEPAIAHLDAQMPTRVRLEQEFELLVRLSREELVAIPDMARAAVEVPVDAARPIRIAVSLRGMDFAPGQESDADVHLPAPGAPHLEVPFRIVPTDSGRGYVQVAVRQLPTPTPLATMKLSAMIVEPDDDGDNGEPQLAEASLIAPPRDLADLPTIAIDETFARGTSRLRITATVQGKTETHEIGFDKVALVDGVYDEVREIRRKLGKSRDAEAVATARQALRTVGSKVAEKLFGEKVGALLWRRRNNLTHLVVQSSGEVDIPWEIVHLVPPSGRPDDVRTNFLGDKGLTRWVYDTARPTELPVRVDRVVGIAPDYTDPTLKLARTQEELRALRRYLAGEGRTAVTPREFREAIRGGVDLVHFAGHGRWRETDPRGQEIAFADFVVALDDRTASYGDFDAREDLPELDDPTTAESHPIVFFSACDVGRLRAGAAGLGGFAEVFLRGGVGVFIGCSWAVQDDAASAFVKTFYRQALEAGVTLGQATLAARRAAHRAGDLNALAFTVFADPRARLVRQ